MRQLTFVIPWCDRQELRIAWPENSKLFAALDARVIVVNGGGSLDGLKRMLTPAVPPGCSIVDMPGAVFNKCRCLNVGVSASETDEVFLLDADVILSIELVDEARRALAANTFVAVRKGEELVPDAHPQILRGFTDCLIERCLITELRFRNGRTSTIEFWHGLKGRSLSGLVLLRRSDYVLVEGCNSALSGWGFEDQDFQIRLQVGLGLKRVPLGTAIHVTHEQEALELRTASEEKNVATCFANYDKGNFLGTYSADLAEWASRINRIAHREGLT